MNNPSTIANFSPRKSCYHYQITNVRVYESVSCVFISLVCSVNLFLHRPLRLRHGLSLEDHLCFTTLKKLLLLEFLSDFDAVFCKRTILYCIFRKSNLQAAQRNIKCQNLTIKGQKKHISEQDFSMSLNNNLPQ